MTESSVTDLGRDLQAELSCEYEIQPLRLGLFATDASHYQIMPQAVVYPKNEQDVAEAVRFANRHELAITGRGAGTSLSGQTINGGLIIDMSRHMDQMLRLDAENRIATVQPGLILTHLNAQLEAHGLQFPPDPATSNRSTIGGMIANNSAGMRSIGFGMTCDYIEELRVVLSDGSLHSIRYEDEQQWAENAKRDDRFGEIHRVIEQQITTHREQILQRWPDLPRRPSGYDLKSFCGPKPWHLGQIITGSEGTLAMVTEAKLRLIPCMSATSMVVMHFDSADDAMRDLPQILTQNVTACELLDRDMLVESLRNPATAQMTDFLKGQPGAVLIVEVDTPDQTQSNQKIEQLIQFCESQGIGTHHERCFDHDKQKRVWTVRKLGLGLISNVKGPQKGQAFIEDACVPVDRLADYIARIQQWCDDHDVPLSQYAHASVGVIHLRPALDLHRPEHVRIMRELAEYSYDQVCAHGGVFSCEHGLGMVRSGFVRRYFGEELYQVMKAIKQAFDPDNRINPGRIIDPPEMTDNLRYHENYKPQVPQTQYRYADHGGFALAVEQCNGVGACRKVGEGVMCPSYMATRDEAHSTRGRANALRLAMTGQLPDHDLTSDAVYDVLKWCLSCKACKSECPNEVDMAKFKAEVLQLRHDKYGADRAAQFMARFPDMARLASKPWARPFARLTHHLGMDRAIARVIGIDRRRQLPALGDVPLNAQVKVKPEGEGRPVILFADCYAGYAESAIGVAAHRLLRDLGCAVTVADVGCCQRPALSKGMLRFAAQRAMPMLRKLDAMGDADTPIVIIEPSCGSSLVEDLPDLVDDRAVAERVAKRVVSVEAYVADLLEDTDRYLQPKAEAGASEAVQQWSIHGHCHQKTVFTMKPMQRLMARTRGINPQWIEAGCCGMAGSFGYEHHDLSMKIAEDRLFPAIRAASEDASIIASGFSCRHQIHDGLDRRASHWLEHLQLTDLWQ